jgi:ribosomal protein S18 acetylase RimI-like enzyme
VGISLLAAAEEDMKQRGMKFAQLEVSERNEPAISLYQKAGYTIKQRLVGFYRFEHNGTRDAIRLVKPLFKAP